MGFEHHRVMVLQDGLAWEGRAYRSLSEIAKTIIGTKWNGPRFFGLRDKKQAEAAEIEAIVVKVLDTCPSDLSSVSEHVARVEVHPRLRVSLPEVENRRAVRIAEIVSRSRRLGCLGSIPDITKVSFVATTWPALRDNISQKVTVI